MSITRRRMMSLTAAASTAALALPAYLRAASASPITLTVATAPAQYRSVYETIGQLFMAENPDIQIDFPATAETYEAQVQASLRASITGDMPDVAFHGLNQLRIFADRELAVELDQFIRREVDWSGQGYRESISAMGRVGEAVYGIPFAISIPSNFLNLDLVARAGADPAALPTDWDGIIDLGAAIDAGGNTASGIYYDYGASGAFGFQTLLFSKGGRMMSEDEREIAFDGPEGIWALELLRRFGEAGQPDITRQQARQSFAAGALGIYTNTTSNLTSFEKQVAGRYPIGHMIVPVEPVAGRLPAAGNLLVMFAREPARQDAAWRFIKFATSPAAQTVMVKATGYSPVNSRAADDPTHLKTFFAENPNYAIGMAALDSLTGWYAFPGQNGIRITDMIRDQMQAVITLEKRPEDAMATMVEQTRTLLASG